MALENKSGYNININSNKPLGYVFFDIDGTLIEKKSPRLAKVTFEQAARNIKGLEVEDVEEKNNLFSAMDLNYIVQFLIKCKKKKGYGTVFNFANFLKNKTLFSHDTDIRTYMSFVDEYLRQEQLYAGEIGMYGDSKKILENLKSEGYKLYIYSNWFKCVQKAKLQDHGLLGYFSSLYTIDEEYAKSTTKGWNDILIKSNIKPSDVTIMIGDSSSDIVPLEFGIPSLIRKGTRSKYAQQNGIIIESMNEVLPILKEEQIRKRTLMR